MKNSRIIADASDILQGLLTDAISTMFKNTPVNEWWGDVLEIAYKGNGSRPPKDKRASAMDLQALQKYLAYSKYAEDVFYKYYEKQIVPNEKEVYKGLLFKAIKLRNTVLSHKSSDLRVKYDENHTRLFNDLQIYISLAEPFRSHKELQKYYRELVDIEKRAFSIVRSIKIMSSSVVEELMEYNICTNARAIQIACLDLGYELKDDNKSINVKNKAELYNDLVKYFRKAENALPTASKEDKMDSYIKSLDEPHSTDEATERVEQIKEEETPIEVFNKHEKLTAEMLDAIIKDYNLTVDNSVMLDKAAWNFIERSIAPLLISHNKQAYLDHTLVKNVLALARIHYTEEEAGLMPQSVIVKEQAKNAHKSMIRLKEHGLIEIVARKNKRSSNSQEELYEILQMVKQPFAVVIQDDEFAKRCANIGRKNLIILKAISASEAVVIRQ
ncbi:hypothetical protein MASR2M70_12890 [Bacillota bacterium]